LADDHIFSAEEGNKIYEDILNQNYDDSTLRIRTKMELGDGLATSSQYISKGLIYLKDALTEARNKNNKLLESGILLKLSSVERKLWDIETAKTHLNQVFVITKNLKTAENWPSIYLSYGEISDATEEYESAKQYYLQAISNARSSPILSNGTVVARSLLSLSSVLSNLGEFSDAESYLQQARSIYDNIGEVLGQQDCLIMSAYIAYRKKDFNLALKILEQADNLYKNIKGPQDKIHSLRGNIYYAIKSYDEAIDAFTKAYNMDAFYPPHLLNRAKVYLRTREMQRASADIQLANNIKSLNPYIKIMEGNLLIFQGKYDEALISYESCPKLSKHFIEYNWGMGMIYIGLNQFDKAIESFKDGLSRTYLEITIDHLLDNITQLREQSREINDNEKIEDIINIIMAWQPANINK